MHSDIPTDPSSEYIGTKLFYPEYQDEVRQSLLNSARLSKVKQELAQNLQTKKNISKAEADLEISKETVKIVDNLIADMSSMTVLKIFALTVKTLLARLYHRGIHVKEQEVDRLRMVAKEAAKNKTSLMFMPSHKSHVDYLVVSYVLYRMGIALPHIAAGDNLNLPFVGYMLRHNGAFFIRREWGGDRLYITIMKDYIDFLLLKGYNIEAFIEGTRSRTGKLLRPKFGFIKLILENLLLDTSKDAIVIPVNIGYDKVIETPSYINELLGTPKEKESLSQVLSSINLLQLKWGRVDVRFGEPIHLRKYVDDSIATRAIDSKGTANDKANAIMLKFGYMILAEVNKMSVIMPTALVGTVLLTLRGRGVGRSELIRRVKWLKTEIASRGGQVAEGQSSTAVIVDRAVGVLSDLIGKRYDILENVYYPQRRFELSYYRNQVIHLFAPESIISISIYSTIKAGGPVEAQRIKLQSKLTEDCLFVSQLLKYEFVFGPGGMEQNINTTLDRMLNANVVEVGLGDDGEEWVSLSSEERRTGREVFDFYCFLMWPFIESYWVATVSLYTLLPDPSVKVDGQYWIDHRLFSNRAQILAKTLYYEGDLSYFESINKETLANAILRLKDYGIIKLHKGVSPPAPCHFMPSIYSTNSNTTWINLSKEWIPSDSLPDALLPQKISPHKSWKWHGPIEPVVHPIEPVDFEDADEDAEALYANLQQENLEEKTRDIESLHSRNYYAQPIATDEDETDHGFNSWSQIRPSGRLWDLCEQIGMYRREGKNRRDTSTVAIRVLRLAQFASSWTGAKKGKQKPVQQLLKL